MVEGLRLTSTLKDVKGEKEMLRFQHPYGGICTVIGEFTPQEIMDWLIKSQIPAMYLCALQDGMRYNLTDPFGMKILDIIEKDREILVYSQGKGNPMVRLEVINK